MTLKARHFYILFVFSILFLDLIFPIRFPYVRILIVLNVGVSLLTMNFRSPKKEFGVFILLVGLFFFSAFLSSEFYDLLNRDLANIILILTFLPLLFTEIRDPECFLSFKKKLFHSIFAISIVVSLIGLYKFFLLTTTGTVIEYFVTEGDRGEERFRLGTSLVGDYNFYAYGLMIGLMTIPLVQKEHRGRFYNILTAFAFFLFSVNIFFSSSRRGIIMLTVYLLIILFRFLWKRRNTTRKKLNFIASAIIGVFGIVFVLYYTDNFLSAFDTSEELNKLLDRIESSSDSESLTSGRLVRIEESVRIFGNYNLFQFLFGNGFDYIQQIGRTTGRIEDYPHNFIVSSALYGGIIGLFFTCFYAGLTCVLYIKKGVHYQLFLIWYVIGIFMLMTSKNSLFSVQFIILLFILPYCNDYIQKRKNNNYVSD